jgi:hypothetical protein
MYKNWDEFLIVVVFADGGAGAGDAGSRNRSPGAEPEAVSNFNPFRLLR